MCNDDNLLPLLCSLIIKPPAIEVLFAFLPVGVTGDADPDPDPDLLIVESIFISAFVIGTGVVL